MFAFVKISFIMDSVKGRKKDLPKGKKKMEKLLERQQELIKEIEEHFGRRAYEVAEDKKLSKDPFFIERDKEFDRIQDLIDTECF